MCLKLGDARACAVPPGLDDKILTGWNGLTISALAIAGRLLNEPRYVEAAHRAADFIFAQHFDSGLPSAHEQRGQGHVPAFLDDYACLLLALTDLIAATPPTSTAGVTVRQRAIDLADAMIQRFCDPDRGGFFFTHDGHDKLLARIKNGTDNATPSAAAVGIRALLRLSRLAGKPEYKKAAMHAAEGFTGVIARQPSMFATLLLALVEDAGESADPPDTPVASAKSPRDGVAASTTGQPMPGAVPPAGPLALDPLEAVTVPPGGAFEIPLVLKVAPGYHVQTNQPRDKDVFATVARLRTDLPLAGQDWHYPSAQPLNAGTQTVDGFAGTVRITAHCTVSPCAAAGAYRVRDGVRPTLHRVELLNPGKSQRRGERHGPHSLIGLWSFIFELMVAAKMVVLQRGFFRLRSVQ